MVCLRSRQRDVRKNVQYNILYSDRDCVMSVYHIQNARVLLRAYTGYYARFVCCKIYNILCTVVHRYTQDSDFFFLNIIHWTSQLFAIFFISVIFYVFSYSTTHIFYLKPWKTTKIDLGCGDRVCVKTHKFIVYFLYHIYDTYPTRDMAREWQ